MSSIANASQFTTANIKLSAPRPTANNGKSCYLNYGNSRKLVFQTPSLAIPFGVDDGTKFGGVDKKFSMELALDGFETNKKVKALYDALSALDEYMIDEGVRNAATWFPNMKKGKDGNYSRDAVAVFYKPTVKPGGTSKKGTPYSPKIRVKIDKARNKQVEEDADPENCEYFDCEFHNASSEASGHPLKGISIRTLIPNRAEVTAILECNGVWMSGTGYGLTWSAKVCRIDKATQEQTGYTLQREEGSEETSAAAGGGFVAEPSEFGGSTAADKKAALLAQAEDDEEEEQEVVAPPPKKVAPPPPVEDDDDEEAEVEPVPLPPKKTLVTKKKVVATTKK